MPSFATSSAPLPLSRSPSSIGAFWSSVSIKALQTREEVLAVCEACKSLIYLLHIGSNDGCAALHHPSENGDWFEVTQIPHWNKIASFLQNVKIDFWICNFYRKSILLRMARCPHQQVWRQFECFQPSVSFLSLSPMQCCTCQTTNPKFSKIY